MTFKASFFSLVCVQHVFTVAYEPFLCMAKWDVCGLAHWKGKTGSISIKYLCNSSCVLLVLLSHLACAPSLGWIYSNWHGRSGQETHTFKMLLVRSNMSAYISVYCNTFNGVLFIAVKGQCVLRFFFFILFHLVSHFLFFNNFWQVVLTKHKTYCLCHVKNCLQKLSTKTYERGNNNFMLSYLGMILGLVFCSTTVRFLGIQIPEFWLNKVKGNRPDCKTYKGNTRMKTYIHSRLEFTAIRSVRFYMSKYDYLVKYDSFLNNKIQN